MPSRQDRIIKVALKHANDTDTQLSQLERLGGVIECAAVKRIRNARRAMESNTGTECKFSSTTLADRVTIDKIMIGIAKSRNDGSFNKRLARIAKQGWLECEAEFKAMLGNLAAAGTP